MAVSPDFLLEVVFAAGKALVKLLKEKKMQKREGSPIKVPNALELTDKFLGGSIGDRLIVALEKYKKTGDLSLFEEIRRENLKEVIFVLEVSRRIAMDIKLRYNVTPHYIVSFNRTLDPKSIPYAALFTYWILYLINALHNGPIIRFFMAAPATLAMQLGQLLGMNKYNILLHQFMNGKYYPIPILRRK
ncbi:MAG: hypothetical protein ACP6IP_04320 [Candidatus Njordarchaeia archaeon]